MPTSLQFRRGTEAQNNAFTGASGELTIDTTNKTIRVHDGSTAGGTRLATYAEVLAGGGGSGGGGLDSAAVIALITDNETTYVNVSEFVNDANYLDSATVQGVINALYVQNNQITYTTADFPDSAGVIALITANETTYANVSEFINDANYLDSTTVQGVIDASYIQANQTGQDFAYSSLTGAPTNVSSFTNDANYLDSSTVTGVIDATYVNSLVSAGTDSSTVATIISDTVDSAYVQLRQTPQDFAYSSLTGAPTAVSSFTNDANYLDSTTVQGVVDASYIQANQITYNTADFVDSAYVTTQINNLIGSAPGTLDTLEEIAAALNNDSDAYGTLVALINAMPDSAWIQDLAVSTFTNDAGYITSSTVETIVDSAYVQARQSATEGTDPIFRTISVAGQSDIVAEITSDVLTIAAGSGIAITTDAETDTLTIAATGGGGSGTLDSATVQDLIDSAYVQARQDFAYSSLTGTPSIPEVDVDFDPAGTDNSTDVTLAGSYDYLTLNAQQITLNQVDASTDISGLAAVATSGAYSDLSGTPTNVSTFVNDANYLDSTTVQGVIDATYVQANQTTYNTSDFLDSATVANVVDSAYVQLRQDFAYSSLTGTPSIPQSGVDFDPAGTDNSTDVTLAGSYDYLTISAQEITLNQIDASTDISNLTTSNVAEGTNLYYTTDRHDSDFGVSLAAASGVSFDPAGTDNSTDVTLAGSYDYLTLSGQQITLGQVDASTDITGLAAVATSGAYSDLTGAPTTVSSFTNDANYLDSSTVTGVIDATYVQSNQTAQDFAYSSLTGAPTTVSSFTNDANYIATNDSAALASLTTTGNITVGGNLQVNGTTLTVNSEDLSVTDNMIYMNAGESAGSPTADIDVGWAANVNDQGSYYHVGLFRDATDETFKVFHQYTPEPDASVQINTGHASFALAPFQASTLTGQYLGFDSDVTAAGLATQAYVTTTVDSAYVQLRQTPQDFAFSSLTGTPTTLAGYGITDAFDGAFSSLTGTPTTLAGYGITDAFDGAFSSLTGTPTTLAGYGITDAFSGSYTDLTNKPTLFDGAFSSLTGTPTTLAGYGITDAFDGAFSSLTGTPTTLAGYGITDAFDGAYSSLTGAPTNVSSFTNDANYLDSNTVTGVIDATYVNSLVTAGTDSATVISLITSTVDSAYVAARSGGGGGSDAIFKTISVAGQSDIVADTTTDTLTIAAGSGISLTTDAGTDTITITATGGGAGGGLDSAAVLSLTGVNTVTATTYEFTASATQSTFTGTDDNGSTLTYTPGNILVHRNGILIVSTIDYTATNGTSVILQAGADSGDTISITAYQPTLVNASQTTIASTVLDADSGQTSFTVSHTEDQILVFLNGVLLKDSDDYTSNGSTIVLTQSADSGDQLTVQNFAKYSAGIPTIQSGTPASASAAGTAGTISYDADYIYVCVATDTWKRTALSTW